MSDRSETSDRGAVARYYDRLAPVYGDGVFFGARRAAVLAAIADELASARRVLDLGCGNGAFVAEFSDLAPHARIVGMDLSPGMLQAAHRRLHGRADFLQGDAGDLPFRSGTFDVVFMSHVLMLVPNMERCVADIARCLVPGGRLIATIGMGAWHAVLGGIPEALVRLRSLFAAPDLRTFDDAGRAGAACSAAGLRPETRRAPYAVGGEAMEEWIHIRWLTTFTVPLSLLVKLLLPALRWRMAGRSMELAETVLVATKP